MIASAHVARGQGRRDSSQLGRRFRLAMARSAEHACLRSLSHRRVFAASVASAAGETSLRGSPSPAAASWRTKPFSSSFWRHFARSPTAPFPMVPRTDAAVRRTLSLASSWRHRTTASSASAGRLRLAAVRAQPPALHARIAHELERIPGRCTRHPAVRVVNGHAVFRSVYRTMIVAASAVRGPCPRAVPACPRAVEHLVGPLAEDARPPGPPRPWHRRGGRPSRVRVRASASTWRYMTESARASYGARRWTAMSSGKSSGHARSDIDTIGSGTAAASSSSAGRRRPRRRRPHLRDQRRGSGVVERLAFVVDRCRRHAGFDQLDPPRSTTSWSAGRGDGHGPAEVMGDPQAHVIDSAQCYEHTLAPRR